MARTIDQLVVEQLGGLTLELAKRDLQIELLLEENAKLKEAFNAKPAKEVEK